MQCPVCDTQFELLRKEADWSICPVCLVDTVTLRPTMADPLRRFLRELKSFRTPSLRRRAIRQAKTMGKRVTEFGPSLTQDLPLWHEEGHIALQGRYNGKNGKWMVVSS